VISLDYTEQAKVRVSRKASLFLW